MKSGDRRWTVEWIQAGQPRSYADSIYKFTVFVEWIPYGKTDIEPNDLAQDLVDSAAKVLGHNFYEKLPADGWHLPKLNLRERLGPGLWRYSISEAYTD